MRFPFPRFPAEFEIPDAWWEEACMDGFKVSEEAFRSSTATHHIALRDIEPPFRDPEVPKDFHGFDRGRLVRILRGFVTHSDIEAVPLLILPPLADISTPPFKYRVVDGTHRFYASVAAGFKYLPADAFDCRGT